MGWTSSRLPDKTPVMHSTFKDWLKKSLEGLGLLQDTRFIEGIPEGLDNDTMHQFAAGRLGGPIKKVRHLHLSGWKHSGAFRLVLTGSFGRTISCIYKNAVYLEGHIAALDGLPISPGPPEYFVYKHAGPTLRRYLPEIYASREIKPGEHYQYLMEDLSLRYSGFQKQEPRLLLVCERLPQIHDDLDRSLGADARQRLLQYDETFSARLLDYAGENLRRLHARSQTKKLDQVLASWNHVADVYLTVVSEIYPQAPMTPIHGDSNITNVLFHRTQPREFRLIDWEWAGIGIAHCDLVSLLKRASPETEQQGLRLYSENSGARTLVQDRYIYEWCKLQRGLLDAAFLAKQVLDSDRPPKRPLEEHIDRALGRTIESYKALQRKKFQ